MRVHELAKELNKENKEVIEVLRAKNVEVKSHMSSLEEAHIAMVKDHFDPKPAPAPVEEAPKKKNVVHVFRPQNSQNNRSGQRPAGQRPAGAELLHPRKLKKYADFSRSCTS